MAFKPAPATARTDAPQAPWPLQAWYVAAFARDIGPALHAVTLLGRQVVLYRTQAGAPAALADRCPHRGVPLSKGTLVDDSIRCAYHGIRIGADGACRHIPCQTRIPPGTQARAYPVQERHGFVWIWMGDPAAADAARIPDVHWMDHPDWTACGGYHHVAADYRLMNDNLLDLSHESFLHDKTIGNEAVAEAPAHMRLGPGTVSVHRDIDNCEPPPFYVRATGFTERIHRWHTTIFTPPSFNVIENGSYPASQTRAQALERRVVHLTTPETEGSCHYFWGVARQYQRDDATLTEFIRQQSSNTFDEDKDMLEAQQRALGPQGGNAFPIVFRTDAGPLQARKLIEDMLAREGARTAA